MAAYRPGPAPSGLFPSGPRPPARPTYREPHRVGAAGVAAGAAATVFWLLLFGLLGTSLRTYAWWTLLAGGLAWATAVVLIRLGDRGVGTGVAAATSVGWSIATVVIAVSWAGSGDWPLW